MDIKSSGRYYLAIPWWNGIILSCWGSGQTWWWEILELKCKKKAKKTEDRQKKEDRQIEIKANGEISEWVSKYVYL